MHSRHYWEEMQNAAPSEIGMKGLGREKALFPLRVCQYFNPEEQFNPELGVFSKCSPSTVLWGERGLSLPLLTRHQMGHW